LRGNSFRSRAAPHRNGAWSEASSTICLRPERGRGRALSPSRATISGLETGACQELPPIDNLIDTIYARHNAGGKKSSDFDFNSAGSQSIDYEDLIRNGAAEGERSELFQAVVWHLASQGMSAEDIVDELAKYPNGIGQKYADRLYAEVIRSYGKWETHKRAGMGFEARSGPWPQILVTDGELPRVVNEAEAALLGTDLDIYQRGELVVRPTRLQHKAAHGRTVECWRLTTVTRPWLVETLTRTARFLKYDARAKKNVAIDAPSKIAETYLARTGQWQLRHLVGVVTTPFLRADGSLCAESGYDFASGLLLKLDCAFPPIPDRPTKEDATAALAVLKDILATFPFCSELDRAMALSAILTALDRATMMAAPLHAFAAPAAGTGKSLLVDLIAIIASGDRMPVIAQGKDEEELEKRLSGELIEGAPLISIDNCTHPLSGSFLIQCLTQPTIKARRLGQTGNILVRVVATIFATGNNLSVAGDLTRRTVVCAMDAKCERPELRVFKSNVLDKARVDRARLVAAGLTILWAGRVAQLSGEAKVLGSFEDWSRRVCTPLVWLGCGDPTDTVEKARDSDPERDAHASIMAQWWELLALHRRYSAQEIIERSTECVAFFNALKSVAASRGGFIDSKRLGHWLKKVEGKILNGLKIVSDGSSCGSRLWKLTRTD
jgi:putative DNA primase/helicase